MCCILLGQLVVALLLVGGCLSQQGFSGVIQNSSATTRTVINASARLTVAAGLVVRWFTATTGAACSGNIDTAPMMVLIHPSNSLRVGILCKK